VDFATHVDTEYDVNTVWDCQYSCQSNVNCTIFSYQNDSLTCNFYNAVTNYTKTTGAVSGPTYCLKYYNEYGKLSQNC
jgi:hypothetical protein